MLLEPIHPEFESVQAGKKKKEEEEANLPHLLPALHFGCIHQQLERNNTKKMITDHRVRLSMFVNTSNQT